MKKLDPRLRHLLQAPAPPPGEAAMVAELAERVGLAGPVEAPATVEVLVRCTDEAMLGDLAAAGVDVQASIHGESTVAAVQLPVADLDWLQSLDGVQRIESSRQLFPELDLSLEAVQATALHGAEPPVDGDGALVGIIDSGVDWTHPSLRNPDGSSRILALWDQAATPVAGSPVPFGRQYTKAQLDAALAQGPPYPGVPHRDLDGHGTHVAGIAAGNGRASQGRYTGVAPATGLLVVALQVERGLTLGRSTRAHQALEWIVQRAGGRPVAINLSQGMNGGGHAGETVLETAVDNLARRPGIVIVKSAGNEQRQRTHAGGRLIAGGSVTLELVVQPADLQDDVIELWYDGGERIAVAVQPPTGPALETVQPGDDRRLTTPAGNQVTLDWELDADGTGATRLVAILTGGQAGPIEAGVWRLHLHGEQVRDGRFDAWIERAAAVPGEQTRFAAASADPSQTITIPGTCRRVLTVASWATRPRFDLGPVAAGQLSAFSSLGPNRLGLRKPDLAAPGEQIASARSADGSWPPFPDEQHTFLAGTSMAAPHVTGAAALLLSLRPSLTGEQVGQLLTRTARRDGFTGAEPGDVWGAGKLDVTAAVAALPAVRFPRISGVQLDGTTLRWTTDVASIGTVRYHRNRRLLQLGVALGELPDPVAGTRHAVDLAELGPGDWYCEVRAVTAQGWWSVDDDSGHGHEVRVAAEAAVDEAAAPSVPAPDSGTRPADEAPVGPRIADLRLEVPALGGSAAVQADMRLRADVRFSLAGAPPDPGGRSCAVHLIAHELVAGRASVLGGQRRRLKADQQEHAAALHFAAPEPGSYRLLATIVLPEEGTVAVTMGPAIEVLAPGGPKRPRKRAAPAIPADG